MMNNVYILFMVAAGAAVAAQIAVNARMREVTGSGIWTANISFTITLLSAVTMLVVAIVFAGLPPPSAALWRAPWWVWLGGFGGVIYVSLAIFLARHLGAATLSAAGILGQLGFSMVIDHYGWFGVPVHRLSLTRLAGAALMLLGVALVRGGR